MHYRAFNGFIAPDYRSLVIAEQTFEGYRREVVGFVRWVRTRGYVLTNIRLIDCYLEEYLHWLHPQRGKGACSNVLSGVVHFFPEFKGRLYRASLTMRGINRAQPGKQWTPIPWHLAVLVAFWQSRVYGLRYGIATLVGQHCLLRVSEIMNIRTTDVVERRDDRFGRNNTTMVIRLRKTKAGMVQSVSVDDHGVEELLMVLLRCTRPGERLFPFTSDKFRKTMHAATAALGIRHHFVPHGLRHAGASEHWMRWRDLGGLALRGRWASERSVRRYVQEGEMMLVDQSIPDHIRRLAFWFARDVFLALTQRH